MRILFFMVAAALVFSVQPAFAEGGGGQASPGGTDGCGLGWQVTDKKTFLATTTRGTTNAFIPPSFGMTSGTIGCETHQFVKKEYEAVIYAQTNFETLKMEMAEGQGEHLEALARTMGCGDVLTSEFVTMTQKQYRNLTGTGTLNGVDLYRNLKSTMKSNESLQKGCSVLSS